MVTIQLLVFNNYADRLYRKYENAAAYDHAAPESYTFNSVNFAFENYLNAIVTLNIKTTANTINYERFNYACVAQGNGMLRYFITSVVFQNNGQATFTLLRDVLADFSDYWLYAPSLIHRASEIPDSYSFARFRKDMDLSQVKSSETILKDRTDGRGWIVGYITKNFISSDSSAAGYGHLTVTKKSTEYSHIIASTATYAGKTFGRIDSAIINVGVFMQKAPDGAKWWVAQLAGANADASAIMWAPFEESTKDYKGAVETAGLRVVGKNFSSVEALVEAKTRTLLSEVYDNYVWSNVIQMTSEAEAFRDGDLVYCTGDSKTYRVSVNNNNYTHINAALTQSDLDASFNALTIPAMNRGAKAAALINYYDFYLTTRTFTFTEVTSDTTITLVVRPDHDVTADSAYDVFAIPLGGSIDVHNSADAQGRYGSITVNIDDSYVMDMVNCIISKYKVDSSNTSGLIDIQWLPYGPDTISADFEEYYNVIRIGSNPIGVVYWLKSCQLEKTLINADYVIDVPADNLSARVLNETTMWRLVSPNQASMFDFSAVRNGGVSGYNIDVAFKPFTPYICVAPIFSDLYGGNYNDGRGLIFSGEFSLDQVSSAWNEYKYNNKNYELIFNRQIATMDVSNTYAARTAEQQRVTNVMSTVTGTMKGAGSGAFIGGKVGGAYGAVAGAVIGGGTALASGMVNAAYDSENAKNEIKIRALDRQNAIAQYQYQLSNIQARGDTITKISTFNPNNKIYPVLETYTCTYQERTQLATSIKWNGISLEMFGSASDFGMNGGYLSLTPLRLTGAPLNPEIYNQIVQELAVGIYLYGSNNIDTDEEEET